MYDGNHYSLDSDDKEVDHSNISSVANDTYAINIPECVMHNSSVTPIIQKDSEVIMDDLKQELVAKKVCWLARS